METSQIYKTLNDNIPHNNIELEEFTGPKVGAELKSDALKAIGIALLLITLYISFRFDRFFAYGSLAALLHDIIIILGIFSFLQKLTILALGKKQ